MELLVLVVCAALIGARGVVRTLALTAGALIGSAVLGAWLITADATIVAAVVLLLGLVAYGGSKHIEAENNRRFSAGLPAMASKEAGAFAKKNWWKK